MSSVSASLPSVASLPSLAPFAHSKLTALPAVDMEHDRLARTKSDEKQVVDSSSRPADSLNVRHAVPPAPLDLEDTVFSVPSALAWSLRPRATSVRVSQRHQGSASYHPSRPRSTSQPASIPAFAPSSPCAVLRSLRDVLDLEGVQMEDCLDVQTVCERWQVGGERDRGLARGEAVRHINHHKTFGSSVAVAVRCASMSTVLGGYQHDVPWVVYACVEELNRTGIYQPGLFRAVPNRPRLARLIEAFDLPLPTHTMPFDEDDLCPRMTTPTPSTTRASLRKESMPDICALLKTYLDLLPEPLLDINLAAALHRLCVQPCLARENEMDDDGCDSDGGYFASHTRARSAPPSSSSQMSLDVPMTPSEHRHAQLSLEAPQILLAQHILRLAPPASLALLAYLLGFFTQLPLCPDNGMDFADVARMFGRVLVGGPAADLSMVRECVGWLLERWGRVSDGLFDIAPETAEEQSHSEPVSATKEAFTSPVFSPPLSSADTTPRQAQGDGKADGLVRMQVPYDPGLAIDRDLDRGLGTRGGARPHSTSVSSDGSTSSAGTSVDTDDDGAFTFRARYAADVIMGVEGDKGSDTGFRAVREYEYEPEAAYDPFDRGTRVQADVFALVAAPGSPLTAFSPPASVRSLDVESAASWPSSECSTSRCSPEPTAFGLAPRSSYACARAHSSEPEYGPYLRANETTPRNSAHFTSFEA
ncbi:Rho GTPase activation protein [Trametes coccinea BRFM310]|uniref:Rho GTPase activation protein n=1 Tax=Trametes coccinea (strain BRFM310) TaxID=1353009 RepID=A0A1Y2I7C1_TRAC3|nr:Rho GTPase activation protein [Trametes coccinea BRFM310]